MKNLILLLLLALAPIARADSTNVGPITFTWTWPINPADLGGLSTNDYLTNINFTIWSSTNVVTAPNQYQPVASWVAQALYTNPATFSGSSWFGTIQEDGHTRFYLLTVGAATGQSPFSNQAIGVALPSSGILRSLYKN